MKRVVLVLLAVSLLGACRGRRAAYVAAGPSAPPMYGMPMEGVPMEDVPMEGFAPGATPLAEGQVVGEEGSPDFQASVEEMRRMAQIERQQREVLAQDAVRKGEEAMLVPDFEAARGWFARALEYDPGNRAAQARLREVSFDRGSTTGEFLDRQRGVELVRREQAAAEVRNYLERGRALEAREDYASAVREYQKALAIVSWYTDQATFTATADTIRDLIENAKYKAEVAERIARQEQIRRAQIEREEELLLERERQLGALQAHWEEARHAFRRSEYVLARTYLQRILAMDPDNVEARQLVQVSYDAEHARDIYASREAFDDQWKAIMKDLEFSTLPQLETVVFPPDWLDGIAQRRPAVVGEEGPAPDASVAAILTTLETRRVRNLAWEDQTLEQAVSYLRTVTGLNFLITPTARTEKGADVSINLVLTDASIRTVLDMITEQNELSWEPRGGVVVIATKDEIRGEMVTQMIPVQDLAVQIQHFPGQEINLVPSNFTAPEPPDPGEPRQIFPEDSLVDLIRETIGGEGAWDEPATIEVKNAIIIARNTPSVLNEVQHLLNELRRHSGILVNLEVRFLTAEDNFLRDVGVDVRGLGDDSQGIGAPGLGTSAPMDDIFFGAPGNPYGVPFGIFPEPSSAGTGNDSGIFYNDGSAGAYQARIENLFDVLLGNPEVLTGSGGLSFQHTYLDDTQIEVILRAVEKSERIQQITASRITVYNTQRANLQVLNQVAYVQDYDVEIAQASNIANPVIQTVQDGVVLDVRPVVSADRRFITMELRPTVALLTRPIPTFATSLASGPGGVSANAPVIIQVPKLTKSSVRTTVVMPDGGTLLLGGLKFYEQIDQASTVPWLGQIPILSFLFSRKGHYVNRRNLLVLITAHIVALEELEPRDELVVRRLPDRIFTPVRPEEPCLPCPPAASVRPPVAGAPCGFCGDCVSGHACPGTTYVQR